MAYICREYFVKSRGRGASAARVERWFNNNGMMDSRVNHILKGGLQD